MEVSSTLVKIIKGCILPTPQSYHMPINTVAAIIKDTQLPECKPLCKCAKTMLSNPATASWTHVTSSEMVSTSLLN